MNGLRAPPEHKPQPPVAWLAIPQTLHPLVYGPKGMIVVEKRENQFRRRSRKRRRVRSPEIKIVRDHSSSVSCTLVLLPDDCRIYLLQFLTPQELHESYALVSTQCRDDSRNPVLSQTRTGEIVCAPASTVPDVLHRILDWRIRGVFTHPRNRLKISGHENLGKITMGNERLKTLLNFETSAGGLDHVNILDLSFPDDSTPVSQRTVQNCVPKILSMMLPSLKEVDMSYMRVRHTAAADFAMRHYKSLEVFRWNGVTGGFSFSGQDLRHCTNLKELYIDNACMYSPENSHTKECVLQHCSSKLERVSFKNPKYKLFGQRSPRRMPQESIMQFVRSTKSLRWFRSDLSAENVAILKKERPEICFTT